MSLEFEFDKQSQRYRIKSGTGKGQFIGKAAVDSLTRKAVKQVQADMMTIGKLLIDRKISLGTWEEATAKTIKQQTVLQYAIGKGGVAQLSSRDYGIIGAKLKAQYGFLRGFSEDLKAGKLSEAQFWARLKLYAAATSGAYEAGREESHKAADYRWEKRIRNARESCNDCIGYAARGWQAIGSLPNRGEKCACKSNCQCSKEYSKQRTKPTDSVLGGRWGFIGHQVGERVRTIAG